ncbi:MAG: hypothetical protein KAH72_03970 [Flavobacteriaceae bacterium]|nr:hypothetical protein [Flavobacteriaceae bacterium]
MKKILLIEDIQSRQEEFLSESDIELDKYKDKLNNKIGDEYTNVFNKLKDNTFNYEDYSMFILHASAFEPHRTEIIFKIEEYCKKHTKPLVYFSGGSEVNNYTVVEGLEKLELNTKTFYSKNLKVFLDSYDDKKPNILMLSYGDQWKTNTILNVLEKINRFIEDNDNKDDVVFNSFKNFTKLDQLNELEYNYNTVLDEEEGWIYLRNIVKLKNELYVKIREFTDV